MSQCAKSVHGQEQEGAGVNMPVAVPSCPLLECIG